MEKKKLSLKGKETAKLYGALIVIVLAIGQALACHKEGVTTVEVKIVRYTSAHPEKYQALLKYMHIVRLGASRLNGLGWKTYDEQFRLKMGIDPVKSWEIVDQELWLLYMGNTRNSLPFSYVFLFGHA
jgi:hypothetical protein